MMRWLWRAKTDDERDILLRVSRIERDLKLWTGRILSSLDGMIRVNATERQKALEGIEALREEVRRLRTEISKDKGEGGT